MWNYFGVMLASIIGMLVFGYYGFLAWFKIERFRKMLVKRYEKYDKGPYNRLVMKDWMQSNSYLWYARIIFLLGFIMAGWGFLFIILRPLSLP
jgi:hypothetical protein